MSISSVRIELSGERRERIVRYARIFFRDELDQDLSEFQAERVLEFFVKELGAPVYNQAIRDAHKFLQEKLDDLNAEYYEPEESESG